MSFKKWLEDSVTLYPTLNDDPELNGLLRNGLAHYVPPKVSKSTSSKKIDKLFGKENATHDYGAGFVFTDGKSILLLRRSFNSSAPNTWSLPGGGAKDRELPIETAEREAKEEIGATVKGKDFYKSVEENGHWIFFFRKVKPFKCKLNKEHTDWKWVELDELKSYKLHPKLKRKIKSYISRIKKEFK